MLRFDGPFPWVVNRRLTHKRKLAFIFAPPISLQYCFSFLNRSRLRVAHKRHLAHKERHGTTILWRQYVWKKQEREWCHVICNSHLIIFSLSKYFPYSYSHCVLTTRERYESGTQRSRVILERLDKKKRAHANCHHCSILNYL